MGRGRRMPKNDGRIEDEGEDTAPHAIKNYTVLAIDQDVVPASRCENGHIVEWKNTVTDVTVCLLRRVNMDTRTCDALCVVCGLPAVQEPEDAPSESDT